MLARHLRVKVVPKGNGLRRAEQVSYVRVGQVPPFFKESQIRLRFVAPKTGPPYPRATRSRLFRLNDPAVPVPELELIHVEPLPGRLLSREGLRGDRQRVFKPYEVGVMVTGDQGVEVPIPVHVHGPQVVAPLVRAQKVAGELALSVILVPDRFSGCQTSAGGCVEVTVLIHVGEGEGVRTVDDWIDLDRLEVRAEPSALDGIGFRLEPEDPLAMPPGCQVIDEAVPV